MTKPAAVPALSADQTVFLLRRTETETLVQKAVVLIPQVERLGAVGEGSVEHGASVQIDGESVETFVLRSSVFLTENAAEIAIAEAAHEESKAKLGRLKDAMIIQDKIITTQKKALSKLRALAATGVTPKPKNGTVAKRRIAPAVVAPKKATTAKAPKAAASSAKKGKRS